MNSLSCSLKIRRLAKLVDVQLPCPWGALYNSVTLQLALLLVFVFHHGKGIKGPPRSQGPPDHPTRVPSHFTTHRLRHHALLHHFRLPRSSRWFDHRWPPRQL